MAKCPTSRASIQSIMKFSLTLSIILSSLYVSFAQTITYTLPPCADNCPATAGKQAGCDPTLASCFCNNNTFINDAAACLLTYCTIADAKTAATTMDAACGKSSAYANLIS